MKRFYFIMVLLSAFGLSAQNLKPIQLLKPELSKGKSLMQALQDRETVRELSEKSLSIQDLSNLLWAASGINREETKLRTAPSARNWQDIEIYVFLKEGVFLYDPVALLLNPVLAGDHRAATGMQDFVGIAPVNLVLVSDQAKMTNANPESMDTYSWSDASFVAENVYLFCSAFDMGCVVRGMIDRDAVAKLLKLRPQQKVVYGQTVGYRK